MQRDNPIDDKGYFTFAQNSTQADYLEIAYLQALSIKATQSVNKYAVAVDEETKTLITDEHMEVFDYVIDIPNDDAKHQEWKLANEWKAWQLTPFKQTIKLDSDILFPRNIDHWWKALQSHDVCCTSIIRNYENYISDVDTFRKLYKENNLPMLYSGMTYFRYCEFSRDFYSYVRAVFLNWPLFRDKILKNCRHQHPNTDEAYAIAAMLVGEELCYNAASKLPTFTHMKGPINGWPDNDWTEHTYMQVDDKANITVGFQKQLYPFHYVIKTFKRDKLIEQYKRILERNKES